MRRLISYICVLIMGFSCLLVLSVKQPASETSGEPIKSDQPSERGPCLSPNDADVLTVFLTGNELGALKPCGCSGGQLGGLSRRSTVFNSVPEEKRLIVDTGMFVETDGEQDLIKFNIITQALNMLNYDLVNLTKKDLEIGKNLGLLDSIGSVLNVISSYQTADANLPTKFTKKLCLEKEAVAVTVAALDTKSTPIDQVYKLFPYTDCSNLRSVGILILNSPDLADVNEIAEMNIIDCIIIPSDSDEPSLIGDPNSGPLVFSVGRLGRYISKLQIENEKGRLKYSFSTIPVTENLPQEQSLVELYKAYQQFVKEANLLYEYPRFTLPGGLEYAGSESCKSCHEYEYEKWSQKVHAHAYATLEKVGSQFDPECIVCHVVGMRYKSGFVSEQQTSHLKNVGCENCHGPGSEHNATLGRAKTTEPKST